MLSIIETRVKAGAGKLRDRIRDCLAFATASNRIGGPDTVRFK